MKSYELKPTRENLMETFIRDALDRNKDIFWFADILNSLEDNCSIVRICLALNCDIGDVAEIVLSESQKS